jgi:hypothetical protein
MTMTGEGSEHAFGSCCNELKETMSGGDFEPLITVGDGGILYMSVGLIEMDDEEPGMIDHPVFFCPFCGSRLQTVDEVRAKSGAGGEM